MNINKYFEYEPEYEQYKTEFKFCQCIIKKGIRQGQRCLEYYNIDCKHKLDVLKTIKKEKDSIKLIGERHSCRARIKKEIGHGYEMCGRINCKFHSIVSDILNLPDEFLQYENNYNQSCMDKYSSKTLIKFYEYSYKKNNFVQYRNKFCKYLKKVFDFIYSDIKYLTISYVFHLLDTPFGKKVRDAHPKFKNVALDRMNHCLTTEIDDNNVIFISYIQATFTQNPDKKYLTKAKNKKYNIFLLKMMTKIIISYQNSLKYTYIPGGKVFLELQKDFYENMNIALALKA